MSRSRKIGKKISRKKNSRMKIYIKMLPLTHERLHFRWGSGWHFYLRDASKGTKEAASKLLALLVS